MADAKEMPPIFCDTKAPPKTTVEAYVSLGRIGPAIFFGCFARRSAVPLVSVSGGIYNLLIQEAKVETGDNLVVFALDPLGGRVRVAQAWHESFPRAEFGPGELGAAFLRLLGEARPAGPLPVVSATVRPARPAEYALVECALDAAASEAMRRLGTISAALVDPVPARAVSWKPIPYIARTRPGDQRAAEPAAPSGAGRGGADPARLVADRSRP